MSTRRILSLLGILVLAAVLLIATVAAYSGSESGYFVKLVVPEEHTGTAPEGEYNVTFSTSTQTSGFLRTEDGYILNLNLYPRGVGGGYTENGLRLYLVPEQAHISHWCDIPANDPPCAEFGSFACDCGDICVNTTGWWRNNDTFNANPSAPIQAAVNTAAENETICVHNGTYDENVDVNVKNLTIKSKYGAAYTTVQALNIDDHVFYVTADYVNITGFTVLNATNSAGIMLWNDVDHCTILENTISNNSDGIALVESSHNNTLTNNTVSNNNYGIYLLNSSNNNITGNIVWNNTYYGIELLGSCNNNISCNWIHDNSMYGFYLHGSSIDNTIESNNIMVNGVEQEEDIWQYNFYNGQSDNVTAIGNYWGTTGEAEINASIWDYYDNATLGIVDFSGFLDSPPQCAPIPEAATIFLFSAGLLALVGYTGVQRRRSRK